MSHNVGGFLSILHKSPASVGCSWILPGPQFESNRVGAHFFSLRSSWLQMFRFRVEFWLFWEGVSIKILHGSSCTRAEPETSDSNQPKTSKKKFVNPKSDTFKPKLLTPSSKEKKIIHIWIQLWKSSIYVFIVYFFLYKWTCIHSSIIQYIVDFFFLSIEKFSGLSLKIGSTRIQHERIKTDLNGKHLKSIQSEPDPKWED